MQTLRLKREEQMIEYYPYTDKKLDRIIQHGGTFRNNGHVVELHLTFYRMECYGYSIYGRLYREAQSKQVFIGCTISECIRHAKAYLRTLELC